MSKYVVTGGAGFIGANAADHFLRKGFDVTVLDNLSRKGSKLNMTWLRTFRIAPSNFPRLIWA